MEIVIEVPRVSCFVLCLSVQFFILFKIATTHDYPQSWDFLMDYVYAYLTCEFYRNHFTFLEADERIVSLLITDSV